MSEFNFYNEEDFHVGEILQGFESQLLQESERNKAKDLELLTQIICDRFSQRLKSEMERRGFHQSNRTFSHQMIATQQTVLSSLKSEQAEVLERLSQEIEQLLYYRLIYERERLGRSVGCLPW
jgi:hypothetical protein